jgi:hypothetical protein
VLTREERGAQPRKIPGGSPEHGGHPRGEDAGDGVETARAQRHELRTEKKVPGLGREQGKGILKTEYGRTRQSTVPVRCTPDSAQEKDFERAAAGAPDIAQCSVRCTPDCPVSPDRGKI